MQGNVWICSAVGSFKMTCRAIRFIRKYLNNLLTHLPSCQDVIKIPKVHWMQSSAISVCGDLFIFFVVE